jgi:tetratricopeptide (TPR) repeat protein
VKARLMADERSAGATAEEWCARARELMAAGKGLDALSCAERAARLAPDSPEYVSLFALLIIRERGQVKRGLGLAESVAEKAGGDPEACLNLSAIYAKLKRRNEALRWIQTGLERAPDHAGLLAQRRSVGVRRRPVLPFLKRNNPLNKYLGLLAAFLRLR